MADHLRIVETAFRRRERIQLLRKRRGNPIGRRDLHCTVRNTPPRDRRQAGHDVLRNRQQCLHLGIAILNFRVSE